MSDSIISVIVPIYNTGKYLNRCVDSIANQTYRELEIILVDDGSTDNCSNICDEYAFKDNRIKVIHKSNGGLSSARNAGLDVATGDFISFVDSDDWIEKELFEILYMLFVKTKADIIIPTFVNRNTLDYLNNLNKVNNIIELTAEHYFIDICKRKRGTSVCGRLFKREIFKELRFPSNRLNEDFVLYSELLIKQQLRLIITEYQGYTYFTREGSITHQTFGASIIDAVYNTQYAIELSEKFNKNLIPYCKAYNAYQSRTALICMPNVFRKNNKNFEGLCISNIKANMKYCGGELFTLKDFMFCRLYVVCPFLARIFTKRCKR